MFVLLAFLVLFARGHCFIRGRSIGTVTPSYSKILEGSMLVLDCTLERGSTHSRSGELYFVAVYNNTPHVVDSSYYQIVDSDTVRLQISPVKREHGNVFKCYLNDSSLHAIWVGSATVDIGNPPRPIFLFLQSNSFKDMTANWCLDALDPVKNTFTWAFVEMDAAKEVISIGDHRDCPLWVDYSNCSCYFNQSYYQPFQYYMFNITSRNAYGVENRSYTVFAGASIVKPGPATRLKISNRTNDGFLLSWTPSELNTSRYSLLEFEFGLNSTWGYDSYYIGYGHWDKLTKWQFTGLRPNTLYSVTIKTKVVGGNYWSSESMIQARTRNSPRRIKHQSFTKIFINDTCYRLSPC